MNAVPHSPDLDAVRIVVECIEADGAFRSLQREWRALHDSSVDATPFNSWEWLFSWWQTYRAGRELRLLVFRADGTLVGIAPLCVGLEKSDVGTSCRVLRFVGDGSFDSDYLGFIAVPAAHSAVVRRFGEWLSAGRDWDAVALRDMADAPALAGALEDEARRGGWLARVEYGRCAAVELPPSWDEFLQARQSRFRTKLRSLLRKVDDGELVLDSGCDARTLRSRLRSLFELHQARWRAAGNPGVFGVASRRLFYARFAPRFARRGWLRLYSLRRDSTYVAHQLCFSARGVTYLLQEGFDVTNAAASYGQALRAAVMRDLIARGEARYDFLGGYSKHKDDWGGCEARTLHVVIARRNARGWIYFNAPAWRERMAGIAKRVLPLPVYERLRRAASS